MEAMKLIAIALLAFPSTGLTESSVSAVFFRASEGTGTYSLRMDGVQVASIRPGGSVTVKGSLGHHLMTVDEANGTTELSFSSAPVHYQVHLSRIWALKPQLEISKTP